MKPAIDQDILNAIPIRSYTDYTFFGSFIQKSAYYQWYFSMNDNRKQCAGLKQIEMNVLKYTLN